MSGDIAVDEDHRAGRNRVGRLRGLKLIVVIVVIRSQTVGERTVCLCSNGNTSCVFVITEDRRRCCQIGTCSHFYDVDDGCAVAGSAFAWPHHRRLSAIELQQLQL